MPPCPYLPIPRSGMSYLTLRGLDGKRCSKFYEISLEYAQFLWVAAKPAQAILQLNRAWASDLPDNDPILVIWEPPYRALSWMMANHDCDTFMGNPVRHFQHLASRMSGPRSEVRSWRAWACLHISESLLDAHDFPRDQIQIEREQLVIPEMAEVLSALQQCGWAEESEIARQVWQSPLT